MNDQPLALQCLEPDFARLRERVALWNRRNEVVLRDFNHLEFAGPVGADQSGVKLAALHQRNPLFGIRFVQGQFNVGVFPGECLDDVRQHTVKQRRDHPDAQLHRRLGAGAARIRLQLLDLLEDAIGIAQHNPACLGEFNPLGGAGEELDTQLFFERAHLNAQRWLGDIQPLCCAPEVKLLGHGSEVPELPDIHHVCGGSLWACFRMGPLPHAVCVSNRRTASRIAAFRFTAFRIELQ